MHVEQLQPMLSGSAKKSSDSIQWLAGKSNDIDDNNYGSKFCNRIGVILWKKLSLSSLNIHTDVAYNAYLFPCAGHQFSHLALHGWIELVHEGIGWNVLLWQRINMKPHSCDFWGSRDTLVIVFGREPPRPDGGSATRMWFYLSSLGIIIIIKQSTKKLKICY
jgi:hypothetical protein